MLNITEFEPRYIRQFGDLFIGKDNKFFPPREETDSSTLLILTGNIFDPFENLNEFTENVELFFKHCSKNFPYTIIVPGYLECNYSFEEPEILRIIQNKISEKYSNIILAHNTSIQFRDKIRFVCSPLLTDFDHYSKLNNADEINNNVKINKESIYKQNSLSKDFIYNSALKKSLDPDDVKLVGLVTHTSPSSKFASMSLIENQLENVTSYTSLDYLIKSGLYDFYIWGNTQQTLTQRSSIRSRDILFSTNSKGGIEFPNRDFDLLSLIDISFINR